MQQDYTIHLAVWQHDNIMYAGHEPVARNVVTYQNRIINRCKKPAALCSKQVLLGCCLDNNICLMGRVLYNIALIMTPLYNCVCCNLYSSDGGVWHHPV
jgi:hypothetical protein